MQQQDIHLEVRDTGLQPREKHQEQPVQSERLIKKKKGPSLAEEDPKFKSDIERSNILGQIHFTYGIKTVWRALRGRKKDEGIKDEDLVSFPYKRRSEVLEEKILNSWEKWRRKSKNNKASLAWAIIRCTWPMILKCLIIAILFSFIRVFEGWVLKKLIDSYSDTGRKMAWIWSVVLTGCLIGGLYTEHHYNHIGTYFPSHVRGALVSMIYGKATKLSLYTLNKISPGQIINIASNDVNVFDEFGVYFPKLLAAPFLIVASGALLWIYFQELCLVGLGYICLWFPLQTLYIVKSEEKGQIRSQYADERVTLTGESIEGIRLLKMYTWELRFRDRIFELRKKETALERGLLLGESFYRAISFSSLLIATYLIWMPYSLTYGVLTPGKVYSTYYLFIFLRLYGAFFVNQGLAFVVQAIRVIKRIEVIMETPEVGGTKFEAPQNPGNAIEFDNFTGYWTKKEGGQPDEHMKELEEKIGSKVQIRPKGEPIVYPTLRNISLHIKKGTLNAIVGPVGAGKSSIFMALTGEMPQTTGTLRYHGTYAFVEQEPTIFAGTFKESILFGKPYNEEFYKKVIKVCNLETDLQLFPKGDESMIGEKGNNLSGGQRARLALARAVYANADIYLLDDPLSALDAKVGAAIFEQCITGVLKGKTILFATHLIDFAKKCDNLYMIKNGEIKLSGTANELLNPEVEKQGPHLELKRALSKTGEELKNAKKLAMKSSKLLKVLQRHTSEYKYILDKPKEEEIQQAPKVEEKKKEEQVVEEQKEIDQYPGKVTGKTYKELIKGMGSCFFLFITFAAYLLVEFINIAYGRMIGVWSMNEIAYWKSQTVLATLVGAYIIFYLVKYFMLNIGLVRTSDKHHKKMLERVINAPVGFFDNNPIGQILNRFSNDIGTLDRFLPLITMDVLDNVLFILSVIITVAILDPVHLAPLGAEVIFVLAMIYWCSFGVNMTKKYELKTRGPLFGMFSASLSGIVIIRTFGQLETFKRKFANQLHTTIKGAVNFAITSRVLAFWSDFGYNLAEIGVIFITTAREPLGPESNVALAGFSLALILSVSGVLQYTLRQVCMTNILAESAGRIQAYWTLPNEPPISQPVDKELKSAGWPQKGDIHFNKVYMQYNGAGPNVIKNLTLHAHPAERIGCVGRTGAGKSSIIQLLYRLQEVAKHEAPDGCIQIDGVDIATVGLHLLRGNISIIPQSPFILTGTVRYNIDPVGAAKDEEIWRVLHELNLKKRVETLPYQLDTPMTAATSVFSQGQKQLVCLARSMLKPSMIMIMDEATASMDRDTDAFVSLKIKNTFNKSTTFTVAHRLLTIANYDRVLVLDKGQIKEFDEPYKLLVKNVGDDRITNVEGLFAQMVKNTGPIAEKDIFQIAKETYYEKHGGLPFDKAKEAEDKFFAVTIPGTLDDSVDQHMVALERDRPSFVYGTNDTLSYVPSHL